MRERLTDIIAAELFRQCTHVNGELVIERLPIADREPGDDGLRFYGKIGLEKIAEAIVDKLMVSTYAGED